MTYSTDFAKIWYSLSKDMKVYLDAQLAPNLTESQLNVLDFLFSSKARVKPSDLISHLSTTPAAITTLLDRMEKGGLVRRERDADDRRIVWIHLTEKGKREGERGRQIREQFIEQCLNRISAHNQQLLLYLLGKVSSL